MKESTILCNVLRIILFAAMVDVGLSAERCHISEYLCNTGKCIPLDKFCNGVDDCGDKSDEPPYCTPCNRTYFGDVGKSYELEIRRPREDRLPFLCYLNFTATGGQFGDLVQITFQTFTVGKFVSYVIDGCPDGYMTIREGGLPYIGGQWCGSAWGYTVYYSETSSINLTLYLVTLSEQGIGYNFDFKILYKFFSKAGAYLRYGNSSVPSWRGNLIPSTYCDRILDECDNRACRIQSPNYPGVYPRNVTCYYRVEERQTKPGKHALISIHQKNAHKIHIKDQVIKYEKMQRTLRVWDQCNLIQDYLTIYDGMSTEDPVLVRLCGGDVVPDIISSGPNMLLEFHTSPYDNPFHPSPLSHLPGFELDVKVIYVDSRSPTYAKDRKCEFLITSFDRDKNWGLLEEPKHSLPPNITCSYHFQGRHYQNVWIAFVKYHAASTEATPYLINEECNAQMTIWDGNIRTNSNKKINVSMLGQFCKEEVPKLCDHSLLANGSRFTRPCTPEESYISSGSDLTLEMHLLRGSVLFPLNFQLRYEFVDTSLEGSHLPDSDNPCDRIFSSSSSPTGSGKFNSPKNVFYYGRGGNRNLNCGLKFKPDLGEKVQLKFLSSKFGDRSCETQLDYRNNKLKCVYDEYHTSVKKKAEIWISEYPWRGIQIPRHCICSQLKEPFSISAILTSILEVNFTVTDMNITEDYEDFHFEGEYHFVKVMSSSDSDICARYKSERIVHGSSGEIVNRSPQYTTSNSLSSDYSLQALESGKKSIFSMCGKHPWLIEPEDTSLNTYLYLKVKGFELSPTRWKSDSFQCPTANRIIVYTISDTKNPKVICPVEESERTSLHLVEIFSDGWSYNDTVKLNRLSRSLVIEFVDIESGFYSIKWLEVTKRLYQLDSSSLVSSAELEKHDCQPRCPELNACIKSELWCDGIQHCPSGYDESDINCLHFTVPILYVGIGTGILLTLIILILFTSWCKYKNSDDHAMETNSNKVTNKSGVSKRKSSSKHKDGDYKQNGDIYCKRYTVNGSDLYLDCKDTLC